MDLKSLAQWMCSADDAHLAVAIGILNLAAALLVLTPAVVIEWCYRPKQFIERPYTEVAFMFWALHWFTLASLWSARYVLGRHSIGVLAVVDLHVVAAFGFYWSFAKSTEFRGVATVRNLVAIYGALLAWNIAAGTFIEQHPGPEWQRQIWILPSEAISTLSIGLIGWAFWKRYGRRALPIYGLAIPVYAILQQPTYSSIFVEAVPDDLGSIAGLALAKLMFGLVFYSIFFSAPDTDEPLKLPQLGIARPWLSNSLKWTVGTVGGAMFSMMVDAAVHKVGSWLPVLHRL